jgi:molybdenum-dependent DNA-binding transcriptional regulator ModE
VVTDQQVRKLMKLKQKEKSLPVAAAKCGMSENTARKYLRQPDLPSQMKQSRTWRTRDDPFGQDWGSEVEPRLEVNPGLEAKTLFDWLQRTYPGRYADGQLRTLQRRIRQWRALEGPAKEVFFDQRHKPGELCESDFTHMSGLGVTINKIPFNHLIYHFVLTYSNWETGTICFSESFESLSSGLQNALWELGGVPAMHRTDRLTAAVQNLGKTGKAEFTRRYRALLSHYRLTGQKIQAGKPNENGDVEQLHHRLKRAAEQALLLRCSRDFASREEYWLFLQKLFSQLNAGRRKRFDEELDVLRSLPEKRLEDFTTYRVNVRHNSTILIKKNAYSVHSRLIGEQVKVRLHAEHLELWYAQRMLEKIPRIRGEGKHRIEYRHIIDWLVRKPGAFENYRYRDDLFPSSRFKMAYDYLKDHQPSRGTKEYLKILDLAAKESEAGVDDALRWLMDQDQPISSDAVEVILVTNQRIPQITDVEIDEVDLGIYDDLLVATEVN